MNCEHEEAPRKFYDRYVITLSNGQFQKVVHFQNDTLQYNTYYYYFPGIVEVIKKDNRNHVMNRKIYYLNKVTELADSCLDSFWFSKSVYVSQINYVYDQDTHLIQSITRTTNVSSSDYKTDFMIQDGNTMRRDNSFCNSYYNYHTITNKLDIFDFVGEYNGKHSAQLIKYYFSGCHAGPSYSPERSDYSYTLNSDGYVIERIENRYLGYYMHDQKQAQKEKHMTVFTYIY